MPQKSRENKKNADSHISNITEIGFRRSVVAANKPEELSVSAFWKQSRRELTPSVRKVRRYLRGLGCAPGWREPKRIQDFVNLAKQLFAIVDPRGRERSYPCLPAFLPEIVLHALARVGTAEEEKEVRLLMDQLGQVLSLGEDKERRSILENVLLTGDPGLFMPFCRPRELDRNSLRHLFKTVDDYFQRLIPERAPLAQCLVQTILRRVSGDLHARSPLLVGPPGVGKSHMLKMLANALTQAGLPTQASFLSLAGGDGPNRSEQLEMKLLGTDSHYSNADVGQIFKAAKDPAQRLVLVLLDEADKCIERNLLMQLLDPTNPLKDKFLQNYMNDHDMRWKVVFLLSANDKAPFNQHAGDPLWSRVECLEVDDYTPEQKRAILLREALKTGAPSLRPTEKQARAATDKILNLHGSDICLRTALDLVNREIFSQLVGGPCIIPVEAPTRKQESIGFRVM